jgi:hypothetical protein
VLVGTVFLALVCAFFTQQVPVNQLKASLSRYEEAAVPTALGATEFRVIPRMVMDKSHCKVATYRVESRDKHTAVVKIEGDSGGSCRWTSNYDQTTDLHFSEIPILLDHIESENILKLVRVMGWTLVNVDDSFALDDAVTMPPEVRVFNRDKTINLFRVGDRTCTFTMQP